MHIRTLRIAGSADSGSKRRFPITQLLEEPARPFPREPDVFRHVFEGVVRRCMAEGLVRGEGFAIDASIVKADANRQRGVPSTESIDWSSLEHGTRAVHEYLHALEQDGQVGVAPMNISLTDPAARWTAAPGGPAFYAYSTNYLIDVHAA